MDHLGLCTCSLLSRYVSMSADCALFGTTLLDMTRRMDSQVVPNNAMNIQGLLLSAMYTIIECVCKGQVVCIQGLALTLDMNLNYTSAVLLTRAVGQVLLRGWGCPCLFGHKLLSHVLFSPRSGPLYSGAGPDPRYEFKFNFSCAAYKGGRACSAERLGTSRPCLSFRPRSCDYLEGLA
jgi:hypothetical protein